MSKKKKGNNKDWDVEREIEETQEQETQEEQKEIPFDPEQHGVPGLDEFAMRLQVEPTDKPDVGLVLWSRSGRVYSLIDLLDAHLAWSSQAVIHVTTMLDNIRRELKDELDKRHGLPASPNDPNRDA